MTALHDINNAAVLTAYDEFAGRVKDALHDLILTRGDKLDEIYDALTQLDDILDGLGYEF